MGTLYSALEPVVGQWYLDVHRRVFEVVALDSETIEIQFYDGDVAELDYEAWFLLNVQMMSEPNDGIGPFDDLERDELEEEFRSVSWRSYLDDRYH